MINSVSFRRLLPAAAFLLASCTGSTSETYSEGGLVETARGIHQRVITLDTHNDISVANFTPERNYTTNLPTQVNLPKMEEGGLDVTWLVVYTGQGDLTDEGYADAHANAMAKFEAIHWLTEEMAPDRIELALTSNDVRRISAAGKKVAMIAVENAYPLGLDLDNIRIFQEMGARYVSLSHNGHSQFSDSNTGERDDVWLYDGLSDLGRQAVAELNKWGIMIDLSHPSRLANLEAMRLSKAPVIASHSGARAMNDVSRNMDDEQLMALKENGGVIQTVAFKSYVNSEKNSAYQDEISALRQEVADRMEVELISDRRALRSLPAEEREAYAARLAPVNAAVEERMSEISAEPVNVSDFVDHIDYLVNLIGLEHVGISSDFDGGGGVEGWNDAAETFNVTLELVRRGYSEEQIGMIWSGNLLRVLDEVQRVAAQIQAGEA
jgi:membrane dipeptidase